MDVASVPPPPPPSLSARLTQLCAAYGYSCDVLPTANTELQSLAQGAVTALKAVYGTAFGYGPICDTIYPATGSSVDYSYDSGIKYSYTAELRDTGTYGFLLPANQIYPSGNGGLENEYPSMGGHDADEI